MNIKFNSVFGNFHWTATAEVNNEQLAILVPLGALQVAQRSPSTAAEKKMAGYEKRPKGFERGSIPFTPENAEILQNAISKLEIAEGVFLTADVQVVEYSGAEAKEKKFVQAKAAMAKHESANDLETWLEKTIGYSGDTHDEEGEFHVEALRAIDAYVKAEMAKLLA